MQSKPKNPLSPEKLDELFMPSVTEKNRSTKSDTSSLNLTTAEYSEIVKSSTPKSPVLKNIFWAFAVGGGICAFAQMIYNLFVWHGTELEISGIYTSVIMILFGAILTVLGVYDNIAKFAGAGTLVPITGFANAIVAPSMEFKTEGAFTGIASKMFVISGSVIVYGVLASFLCGIVTAIIK